MRVPLLRKIAAAKSFESEHSPTLYRLLKFKSILGNARKNFHIFQLSKNVADGAKKQKNK